MVDETPPILDLELLRASAAKFREVQAALEARGRDLDELQARLESERVNLGGQALAIESVRAALRRDRERVAQARLSLDQDAAALQEDRSAIASDQRRLEELIPLLEDRDRVLQEAEARLARRSDDVTGRLEKSEARLRLLAERERVMAQREADLDARINRLTTMGEAIALHDKKLAAREEEFIRRQNERLAALEERERQSLAFCQAMAAMAVDAEERANSYAGMNAEIEKEIDSIVVVRESAAAEGEWLREAQAILTDTVESDGTESEGNPPPADSPGFVVPAIASPAEEVSAPVEIQTIPLAFESKLTAPPELQPSAEKEGAVGRLAEAIEAWERAREAGWSVAGLRGPAKSAREALASGDYDGAMRLATTILSRIQANQTPV